MSEKMKDKSLLIDAIKNRQFDIIKLQVHNGVSLDRLYGWEPSSLKTAARLGYMEIVAFLLDNKADVDQGLVSDREGTPLSAAAEIRHIDMVKLLVERKADLNNGRWAWSINVTLKKALKGKNISVVRFLLDCKLLTVYKVHSES